MINEDKKSATLTGELGGFQKWTAFNLDDPEQGVYRFDIEARSEWYVASLTVDVSKPRLEGFLSEIANLLSLNQDAANIINEYGNFELNLKRDKLGRVSVEGVLFKSMLDDERLEYCFETDLSSLERFYREIVVFLN